MDRRRGALALVTAALGLCAGVALRGRGARADGIPSGDGAMVYTGTLRDQGVEPTGPYTFAVRLLRGGVEVCTTGERPVMVRRGQFGVPLPNACTAAVRAHPDLEVELVVDGTSLGRTRLGAVPYAVEAGRATELTSPAREALVPPGAITAYGGASAPEGWLLCDGSVVSRAQHPRLFAAIGTAYGEGDGRETFRLPDLRQRLPLGRAASGTGATLGERGGQIDHQHEHVSPLGQRLCRASLMMPIESPSLYAWRDSRIMRSEVMSGRVTEVNDGTCARPRLYELGGDGNADVAYVDEVVARTVVASTSNNPPFQVVNYIIKR